MEDLQGLCLESLMELIHCSIHEAVQVKRAAENFATPMASSKNPTECHRGPKQTHNVPTIDFSDGFPLPYHLESIFGKDDPLPERATDEFVSHFVHMLIVGHKVNHISTLR